MVLWIRKEFDISDHPTYTYHRFNGPLRRAGRQNMGRLEGKVAIVTGEELVIDCGHLVM